MGSGTNEVALQRAPLPLTRLHLATYSGHYEFSSLGARGGAELARAGVMTVAPRHGLGFASHLATQNLDCSHTFPEKN